MPFGAALSEHPDPAAAAGEVTGAVLERLGERPDVALLFVTAAHEAALSDIADVVRALLEPATLVGAVTLSVVGTDREVEERPGVSLWAASGVGQVHPLHVSPSLEGWPSPGELGFRPSAVVLVGDPFSFPAEAFFDLVQSQHPKLPVVGGMASAARAPGGSRLLLGRDMHSSGAVGFVLDRSVTVDVVVSQGCRPIGQPWAVTDADRNIVKTLAGQPPCTGWTRSRPTG